MDRLLAVRWGGFYMSLGPKEGFVAVVAVFGYTIVSLIVVGLVSYQTTPRYVPAICLSIHIATKAYESYQPAVQMLGGVVSILLFLMTLIFYRFHVSKVGILVHLA